MTPTVLVVDDSSDVLIMMTALLRSAGYRVLAASTLGEGRRLARQENPDVIVVDIRLGPYNGLELAVVEHVDHPLRPLIVMSGHFDPVLKADAARLGATYLEKPFDGEELLRLIECKLAPTQRCASE